VTTSTLDVWTTANPGQGALTIYEDDSTANGNAAPTPAIDTAALPTDLYDFMLVSTVRANNRFADAYIQPEYADLSSYTNDNVTSQTHTSTQDDLNVINGFRQSSAQGQETSTYWVVYVCAAYQPARNADHDPNVENGPRGETWLNDQVSLVYLESVRDLSVTPWPGELPIGLAELEARVAVHEVGHQFGLAAPRGHDYNNRHRNDRANIMNRSTGSVPLGTFWYDPIEIDAMRSRVNSPGT
jgi:hypothetical protein